MIYRLTKIYRAPNIHDGADGSRNRARATAFHRDAESSAIESNDSGTSSFSPCEFPVTHDSSGVPRGLRNIGKIRDRDFPEKPLICILIEEIIIFTGVRPVCKVNGLTRQRVFGFNVNPLININSMLTNISVA